MMNSMNDEYRDRFVRAAIGGPERGGGGASDVTEGACRTDGAPPRGGRPGRSTNGVAGRRQRLRPGHQ